MQLIKATQLQRRVPPIPLIRCSYPCWRGRGRGTGAGTRAAAGTTARARRCAGQICARPAAAGGPGSATPQSSPARRRRPPRPAGPRAAHRPPQRPQLPPRCAPRAPCATRQPVHLHAGNSVWTLGQGFLYRFYAASGVRPGSRQFPKGLAGGLCSICLAALLHASWSMRVSCCAVEVIYMQCPQALVFRCLPVSTHR